MTFPHSDPMNRIISHQSYYWDVNLDKLLLLILPFSRISFYSFTLKIELELHFCHSLYYVYVYLLVQYVRVWLSVNMLYIVYILYVTCMYICMHVYEMELCFSFFNLNFYSYNYLYRSLVHALGNITQKKAKPKIIF